MKGLFTKLTVNRALGLATLVLGFLALFLGDPGKGARATIDPSELALMVQREVDHVSPEQLADWIIAGRSDYRLVDLRREAEFAEYHIPTAENIPLTGLDRSSLGRNETVLLYSEGGIHSAQAWFLLKARQHRSVYMLSGGLDGWKERVLFPRVTADSSAASLEKLKHVSAFFGGSLRTGSGEAAAGPTLIMPKPQISAPPVAPAGGTTTKKKKEGC
ncbi:MAG: rhodanese-like domain-containing protein [Bacteroidota bacterium]